LTRLNLRDTASTPGGNPQQSKPDTNAIALLGAMLADKVPQLHLSTVLGDSPRWPRDLNWSKASNGGRGGRSEQTSLRDANKTGVAAATRSHRSREIDDGLRVLAFRLRESGANSALTALSMFPTPPMRYFGAHVNSATCKPHLRMLGQTLFGASLNRDYGPPSGGIFTRFMIAGFATYRALETIGAEAYECYPDLQFRLWCRHHRLFAKNSTSGKAAALASRIRVLSALARRLGVSGFRQIRRLDEADAAILALSVIAARKHGETLIFENSREGRFMVALDEPEAQGLEEGYAYDAALTDSLHGGLS